MKILKRVRDSKGQSMLEYILIVIFVALVAIAAWRTFGNKISHFVKGSAGYVEQQMQDSGIQLPDGSSGQGGGSQGGSQHP